MNCAKIREFLMTDYIDGEAGERTRATIMNHIASCDSCRRFELELKEKAVAPFKSVERRSAPPYVWERIKDGIRNEPGPSPRPAFKWRLKPILTLSAVAASILAIILLNPLTDPDGTDPDGNGSLSIYLAEQSKFISDSAANGTDISGFGTSIEEYLLS